MARTTRSTQASDELPDEVLAYLYSSLIFLLRRTDQAAVSLFNEAARELRLTLPQFHILYIASEVGAFSQVELAKQVATNEASASTTISALIERGLLTRSTDISDGRRKLITATPAGNGMIEAAVPAFMQALAELEAPLGTEAGRVIELLSAMVDRARGTIAIPPELGELSARRLHIVHHSIHFLVRRVIQLIEAATSPHLVASGLTLRQYVVLLIITLAPGIGESRIASTIGLDLSNTSFIARGLRTKKMVAVDESTRRRRYEPTTLGRASLAAIEPALIGAVASILGLLDNGDREPLLRLLGKIITGAKGTAAPPAFARISKGPNWPTAQRPEQFDRILEAGLTPDAERLGDLLRKAADTVGASQSEIDRLSLDDKALLRDLLRQILRDTENRDLAAG